MTNVNDLSFEISLEVISPFFIKENSSLDIQSIKQKIQEYGEQEEFDEVQAKETLKKLVSLQEKFREDISFLNNGPFLFIESGVIKFDSEVFLDWEDDEDILSFIKCSAEMPDSNVDWYDSEDWEENETISEFTNQFVKLLGPTSKLHIFWQAYNEDGWDSYSVTHTYDPNSASPSTEVFIDHYEE